MITERFILQFDIVQQHFRGLKYFGVGCLKGPFDFLMLHLLRTVLPRDLFQAPAIPVLAFPLGTRSELENESLTYIGGHVIHKSSAPWPRGANSVLLPFIAQIDLRSLNDPSCCAIQIFGTESHFDYRRLASKDIESSQFEEGESISKLRLYGTKPIEIPSYSFSGLEEQLERNFFLDGRPIYDLPYITTPLGVIVGCVPYIPAHAIVGGLFEGLYVIACLPTIIPRTGVPFEFVDMLNPMNEEEANAIEISIGTLQDDDSYGLIYVCRSFARREIVLRYISL